MFRPGTKTAPRAPASDAGETHSRLIFWTMLSAALAVLVGQWWLSPVICTAPLVYAATRHGKIARTPLLRALTIRWAMTIVATTLIASVFFTQRVPSSVPFGTGAVDATRHWLSGGAKPMWGFGWLLIMPLAIGVATVLGGGVLGAMLLCALLTHATVSASLIYANSTNLFPATLIAFSPWQWAFLVAAVLALPPLTTLSLGRLYRQPRVSFDPAADRRALILAGALFAFAIVLRLALSGVYSSLVLRWTLP